MLAADTVFRFAQRYAVEMRGALLLWRQDVMDRCLGEETMEYVRAALVLGSGVRGG